MMICGLTKADAPFNCGSNSMGVSIEIRGSFLANYYLLQRYKEAEPRRILIFIYALKSMVEHIYVS